jgi:hypothetical protein
MAVHFDDVTGLRCVLRGVQLELQWGCLSRLNVVPSGNGAVPLPCQGPPPNLLTHRNHAKDCCGSSDLPG